MGSNKSGRKGVSTFYPGKLIQSSIIGANVQVQSKGHHTLPLFKEMHSDMAQDRISTRDDESDCDFDK